MASITSHKTSTGEIRWRARVRLRGQNASCTFRQKTHALFWARRVEEKLLEVADNDPLGKYKLVRIS